MSKIIEWHRRNSKLYFVDFYYNGAIITDTLWNNSSKNAHTFPDDFNLDNHIDTIKDVSFGGEHMSLHITTTQDNDNSSLEEAYNRAMRIIE